MFINGFDKMSCHDTYGVSVGVMGQHNDVVIIDMSELEIYLDPQEARELVDQLNEALSYYGV